MTGEGFSTPLMIDGEPWRYVAVPESKITEVYQLIAGEQLPKDPIAREIAELERQKRALPPGHPERSRLANRIRYRERIVRQNRAA